jgi:uncharacterized membrane protein
LWFLRPRWRRRCPERSRFHAAWRVEKRRRIEVTRSGFGHPRMIRRECLTLTVGCATSKAMASRVSSERKVPPAVGGVLAVLSVLGGLGASAALWVDYARASPVFCAEGGGCDAVKHTRFASLWGLPTPIFGLLGFALLAVLVLLRGSRVRWLHCATALLAAAVGARLIAAQISIGQYCCVRHGGVRGMADRRGMGSRGGTRGSRRRRRVAHRFSRACPRPRFHGQRAPSSPHRRGDPESSEG